MNETFKKEEVIQYYQRTEWVYRHFWKLDASMGLHFGFWDNTTKNLPEAIINQNKIMASMVNIQSNQKVLDSGCGVGGSAIYLSKYAGCDVTGITITPKQVITANEYAKKEKVSEKVRFMEMDFCNTKFENETFDLVWAIESVCHADNKKEFLTEAFRILKKGGKLIIADYFPNKEKYNSKEYKQVYTNGLNGWAVSEMCQEKEFSKVSTALGFANSKFINMNEYVRPSARSLIKKNNIWLIPGWLSYKIGRITKTEFMNAYGAYNFAKSFEKLWDYKVFIAEKQ